MTERDIQPRTVRATELYGDLWLNSEPVPVLALRSSVVLLSFWDYACCRSNLLLPYVAAWHRKYAPHGLTVVGVHTPRFTFSQEPLHVQADVRSLRITYPVVLDNGHLIRAHYDDVEAVYRWAAARGLGQSEFSKLDHPLREIEYLTYARLLMSGRKFAGALSILNDLSSAQEQTGRIRALIESLALQALCLRSLSRMDEALRKLARALLFAEPEGFARVFIQEGPPMAALLRMAGAQGHSPEYTRHLLEVFSETPAPQKFVLDPLSERELEVLRLLCEGLTNADIATELTIALSTVKTHVNRIYSKLGVSTRTQAVARARQLQILP